MVGLPGRAPGQVVVIGGLDARLLGLELLATASQPFKPRATIGQLDRQLVAASVAVLGVFSRIDLGGLGEDPIDLLTNRRITTGRLRRSVGRHRRAIDGQHTDRHQPRSSAERQDLRERSGQRLLVAGPKPGDRRVIGRLVSANHPGRNVLTTAPLDRPRGPLPQRIAVEQQRDHHRRIVRGATMTVGAIGAIKSGQIDLRDDIEHQPRQVIVIQPLTQARRQQQRLLPIAAQEVLRHDPQSLKAPGQHKARRSGPLRDSPFGWGDVDVPTIEVLIEGARSGPRQGRLSTERVARWIKVAPVPNAPTVLYDSVCRIETVDGQAVAVDGDSGAVCVDDEGRAVALIVAAEDASHVAASAFAIPFWHIADKLGIRDQHIVVSVDVTR